MKKLLSRIVDVVREDIIGTENRFMAGVWAACLAGVVGLGVYLSSESMSFLGVADSRELQVNFEYPVEIKRVHVIPGQNVAKGDLLVELDQSELNGKIRLLRQQLAKLQAEMTVRQHLNSLVSNGGDFGSQDPLSVDIEDLSQELEHLEEQKKSLYVFADVPGVVGGVAFKEGEKVPSFTSLVTLSPENPSYIQGFVHESLHTRLEVGREVWIKPLSSATAPLEGRVASVGARIVLMPPRLLPYPTMQVYGREVVVEIPPQNGLLLGEKVQIKPKVSWIPFSFSSAVASEPEAPSADGSGDPGEEPREITVPASFAKRYSFEPSGAIYLADLRKYLVVSDDTDKKKSPVLFLLNADGRLEDQTLTLPGLEKIADMESISDDGTFLYVMTSQGHTKKGRAKSERQLFVRARRSGLRLLDVQTIEFRPLFEAALKASPDVDLRRALTTGLADLEIESHLVEGDKLFVGFKNPLDGNGRSVIAVIDQVGELFRTRKLSPQRLRLLGLLDFGAVEGAPHRLSELIRVKGQFYAATVCDAENCGAVWRLDAKDDVLVPELLRTFAGLKPEALAHEPGSEALLVLFDQKQNPAKFARVPLRPSASAPGATSTGN